MCLSPLNRCHALAIRERVDATFFTVHVDCSDVVTRLFQRFPYRKITLNRIQFVSYYLRAIERDLIAQADAPCFMFHVQYTV